MPELYAIKEVKKPALHVKWIIERNRDMLRLSEDIFFAEKYYLVIGKNTVRASVFYDPERDRRERIVIYSNLQERMEKLSRRDMREWEKPSDIVYGIMGPYRSFISWKYDGMFHLNARDNAVLQRMNRCGITIITFTGYHYASHVLSEYRKRDSVEKRSINCAGSEMGSFRIRKEPRREIIIILNRSDHLPTFMRSWVWRDQLTNSTVDDSQIMI
ncbi:MAG: hypothetical protein QXU18_05690 [Thermoplasmatales archaeon]